MTAVQSAQPKPITAQGFDYYYRMLATLTFLFGLHLHVSRLQLSNDDLLLRYILTPTSDILLSFPMTLATIAGWLCARRMVFRNPLHLVVSRVTLVYLTLSTVLHFYTVLFHKTDAIVTTFPLWYSWFFLGLISALLAGVWNLGFKK